MNDLVETTVGHIKNALDSGKKYIIFNCPCEALQTHPLDKVHLIIERVPNLDMSRVFYMTGTVRGSDEYQKYADAAGHKLRMNILGTISQICNFRESIHPDFKRTVIDKEYEIKIKGKKFVCFNRVHKGHRAYILARMFENGLVDQSYYSFQGEPNWISQLDTNYNWAPIIKEQFTKNLHRLPLKLNITPERSNPVQLAETDLVYHYNSYFSLVNETVFYKKGLARATIYCNEDGVFFTEKTARPLMLKHPFVLTASVNSLRMLRSYGFQTFHPFIDESYDLEEDDDRRLDMIVAETERLCRFTDDQWIEFQTNVKPIVEHNYRNLFEISYHGIPNLLDKFK